MSGWSVPIGQLANKMQANVDTIARKVTLDLFAAVVKRSPVDTGRFKSNWNFSYSAPDYSVTDGASQGRGEAQSRRAASMSIGGTTYLSNGLPYAARLEHGYSQQAPVGMVRLSVAEFSAFVRKATR